MKHYKVDASKVYVTYNAVNDSFRRMTDDELCESELRSSYGIGDCPYMLTVGNLQPRKNLPRLIRAFIKMQEKSGADIKLVIVGKKAWMFNEIISEAVKNSDRIVLADYVKDEDLVRLYNVAECFIYPSFFEGFGLPPLEAMACGIPVAVADRTSLPEVVGDAGLFFDPFDEGQIEDAMEKLLSDSELRESLIEKGFIRSRDFSWKATAKFVMDVYHEVG